MIVGGGLVFAIALWNWVSPNPSHFVVYLGLTLIASMLKFRLPRINGTYSASFLFTLVGIVGFSLPETLVASCAGALVQSVWKAKQRPSIIQLLFNMANLILSISLCFLIAHRALGSGLEAYRPAVLAVVAAVHFFTSTMLVSGVLSLLQGKPLRQVYPQWYVWFLPYYLIGAVIVGLLPLSGQNPAPEGWLILLPLLYLIHFFHEVSGDRTPLTIAREERHAPQIPYIARCYMDVVIAAGVALVIYAASHWESHDLRRFLGYLAMTLVAATFKVRLPGLNSTISVSFVLSLVAIMELSYAEAMSIAAVATVVQTIWKAQRAPQLVQIAFNSACMVLCVSAAYVVCRLLLDPTLTTVMPALFIAAALLYGSNTLIVATAVCLTERRPLRMIWQRCYFWSFPYYVVGATASSLMIAASRSGGWQLSLAVFPVLTFVYVSYRLHTNTNLARELVV